MGVHHVRGAGTGCGVAPRRAWPPRPSWIFLVTASALQPRECVKNVSVRKIETFLSDIRAQRHEDPAVSVRFTSYPCNNGDSLTANISNT
jgi:hypothetical protein